MINLKFDKKGNCPRLEKIEQECDNREYAKFLDETSIWHFAETGEYIMQRGTKPVVHDNDTCELMVYDNGVFIPTGHEIGCDAPCTSVDLNIPPAVAVDAPRTKKTEKHHLFIINNGDQDELASHAFTSGSSPEYFPTMSFECVRRLLDVKHSLEVGKLMGSGKLSVVDYTLDQSRRLTDSQLKKYAEKKYVPPPGFTKLGEHIHRSGTIVLRDTRKNGSTYLVGMDEDTYFGVELEDHPGTVEEAFESLMPKEARGVAYVVRQGEWFVIPIEIQDIPNDEECDLWTDDYTSIKLPIDDPDSNIHRLECAGYRVCRGVIYACDPKLYHDQHETINKTGWYKVCKNTAVQSVSVEGVD